MPVLIPLFRTRKANPETLKAMGVAGFVFFLLKGLLWLLLPVVLIAGR